MQKFESVKRGFDLAMLPIDLIYIRLKSLKRKEQNESTTTMSTLRKHNEIDASTNIPKLSIKKPLANGKTKQSIATPLIKPFQPFFEKRRISYFLVGY